jgi:tetratricopeptide (TPR) repeat protein
LLNELGRLLGRQGRWEEAVGCFRAIRARRPNLGRAFAHALRRAGRAAEGEAVLRELVHRQSRDPEVYSALGVALEAKGQVDEAIRLHRKAIELGPENAIAHANLGTALFRKGQLDEAIRLYRKAIELGPQLAAAHSNLGAALKAKGQVDEAIRHYRKAIELGPRDAEGYAGLGVALYDKGQVDEAIPLYRKAIELRPKHAASHANLGTALHAKGQVDEAIRLYRKAIELGPKLARAHYNLGLALLARGQLDEAIQLFRKAIDLRPTFAEPYGGLGQALLQQGQFAQAKAATRRFIDLLPANHPLRALAPQEMRVYDRLLDLDARLPAVLQGKAKPADTAERLAFAQLCGRYKQRYAAAARLYAEAFAEQPRLAQNLRAPHRYHAARAAALAAGGQGKDAAELTDEERARLRKQALDWLRADLAACAFLLDKVPTQARSLVQQSLQDRQKDAALVSLRDAAALAKLPEAERQAWQKLWAEVGALLKRAQPKAIKP